MKTALRYRKVGTITAAMMAVLVIACSTTEGEKTVDSVAERDAASKAVKPLVQHNGERGREGRNAMRDEGPGAPDVLNGTPTATAALPDKVENLTREQLLDYLDERIYATDAGQVGQFRIACETGPGVDCTPAQVGNVTIQPEWGMHLVAHGAIPANGMVIARVHNSGQHKIKKFDVRGGQKVFWLVDQPTPGRFRSRFIRVRFGGPKIIDTVGIVREYHDCGHTAPQPPDRAVANWLGCPQELAASDTSRGPRDTLRGRPFVPDTTSWLTCLQGCCTAGARWRDLVPK